MSGLIIYDKLEEKKAQQKLEADTVDFFTNIAESWLPADIDSQAEGSHNGTNYIAYTFYVENRSDNTMNYWYQVVLDDVIKRAIKFKQKKNKIYIYDDKEEKTDDR